ncbi:helix-turn-helix domain-containing protein [Solibacillus sp. MA9]|uniref:Helix-turn-helix domain-containing protein n=1 Tax=Solibacillus palustris TaxID=2908203 RepID=A0ABS9UGE9_9BACL|nr:helix-turn-helix domain-containing protein [Solibacillus sp. MA9]MCH7323397.1 helix-turn-helix domain-containing protein [Solibacillus sp. MA9]
MIEKLANHFQVAFTTEFTLKDTNNYWFQTEDGQIFGLLKSALSDVELGLLQSLFLQIEDTEANSNTAIVQLHWQQFLFGHSNDLPFSEDVESIRFFYFRLKQPIIDPINFEEAIKGAFQQPIVLWINNMYGIIIEEKPQSIFDKEEFIQLSDTLTSDFLVVIYSFIGQLHKADLFLKEKFSLEKQCFQELLPYVEQEKTVLFYEAFPMLLVTSAHSIDQKILSNHLIESLQDGEMLHTLKVFLQYNLNASLAAKRLHIHRNSLQYRFDKLINKTGIDCREFSNAAFLALVIPLLTRRID